jgi:hypothetical protein
MATWYEARLTMLHVFVNMGAVDLPPIVLEDAERERLLADMRRFAGASPETDPLPGRLLGGFAHRIELWVEPGAGGRRQAHDPARHRNPSRARGRHQTPVAW